MPEEEIEYECISVTETTNGKTYQLKDEGNNRVTIHLEKGKSIDVHPGEKYRINYIPIEE